MSLIEKMMPKGWTALVDEAVTKTLREEIVAVLAVKFPEVRVTTSKDSVQQPGFSYAMREYVEKKWTEILKTDPEIDTIIREGLKDALIRGFAKKPE